LQALKVNQGRSIARHGLRVAGAVGTGRVYGATNGGIRYPNRANRPGRLFEPDHFLMMSLFSEVTQSGLAFGVVICK